MGNLKTHSQLLKLPQHNGMLRNLGETPEFLSQLLSVKYMGVSETLCVDSYS